MDDDEDLGRLVVELFALLDADLGAGRAAAGTGALGGAEFVAADFAAQVGGATGGGRAGRTGRGGLAAALPWANQRRKGVGWIQSSFVQMLAILPC